MTDQKLSLKIKSLALELGYTACGVTNLEPFTEFREALEGRIERYPEAARLYSEMMNRGDPSGRKSWARSILVCVRRYGKYALPQGLTGFIGRNYLCDRRYPECPDHMVSEKFKEGLRDMGVRASKGGTPDRWAGARAGVTRFGRNCFAYSEHGSWINIETWLVDAELPADSPALEPVCPPNCKACIQACPTGALSEPFIMRMDRCIAYLTYSAPEPVPSELWDMMGTWIYGCDVCQQVCPLNQGKWESGEEAAWLKDRSQYLTPDALAGMSQETYENIVHPLFFYIPKENLTRWHRNAQRALENLRAP